MTTRRIMTTGLGAAAAALLSSCGTIIYPDRANQKEHGDVDPLILGLDAIGLVFFLIPGIIAFAVDFATGAVYFPTGYEDRDREHTIFDEVGSRKGLRRQDIERVVAKRTGRQIDLDRDDVRTMRIDNLDQFWLAEATLSGHPSLAAN
ncbi:MAG: hypothetical protein K9L89_00905 [Kiritimatiellales bacterium]|nr:hypothetical protein [Kiritimatiellales bacterium]